MALITGLKGGTTNITVSYGGQTATVSNFTVNKKTVTFSAPTLRSVSAYTRSSQTLVNEGSCTNGGTMYYYVSTSSSTPTFSTSSWTTTVPSKTDAGTYYLWYCAYVSDTGAYTGTGINTVTKVGDGSVTIPKQTPVLSTSPTKKADWSYNGTEYALASGGAMKHSSTDSTPVAGAFTYAMAKDPGTYTASWSFTPTDTTNYNSTSGNVGTVTVSKATPITNFVVQETTYPTKAYVYFYSNVAGTIYETYNGTELTSSNYSTAAQITKSVSAGDGSSTNGCTVDSGSSANRWTIYVYFVPDDSRYNHVKLGPKTLIVNPAPGTVSISNSNVTYNSGKNLVSVSNATGTVYYRLGTSGSFSTDIPTATSSLNATSYTLYYYVAASSNYTEFGNASSPKSLNVTIAKVSNQITISDTSKTIYDRSGYNSFYLKVSNHKGTPTTSVNASGKVTISSFDSTNARFTVTYAGAGSVTITVSDSSTNYTSSSATCTVTTKVDTISSYGSVSAPSVSQKTNFPAGGVTLASSNMSTYFTVSGSTQTNTWTSGYKSSGSVSYSWSVSSGTVASKGTTISNASTVEINATVTAAGEGNNYAPPITVTSGTQAGNYVTAITAKSSDSNNIDGTHFSYANIGAGAKSASPSLTGGALYTFSSGSTKFDTSSSPSFGGSASYIREYTLASSQNGFTAVNSSTGELTATPRGTTPGESRTSANVTGTLVVKYTHASTYSAGGTVTSSTKSNTQTCTQNANELISTNYAPYNYTASVAIGNGLIAGGGEAAISASASHMAYDYYTSGSYNNPHGVIDTAKWMITSNGNSRFSHPSSGGTSLSGVGTVYDTGTKVYHSSMGTTATTDTVTVTAYNTTSTSATASAEKSITNTKDSTNYAPYNYTASVAIGNGLTAGGGEAAISVSASHMAYDYYTSGSYNNSHSVSDGVSWSIVTQTFTPSGGSASTITRFSKSGNTLSHTTMGTSAGTDYVKVTAVNGSSSSTTASAEKSITNEVVNSDYNASNSNYNVSVNIGSGLNAGKSEAAVSVSGSHTHTYYYLYTSGSTSGSYTSNHSDSPTWSITSQYINSSGNTIDRFSKSGNKLSHATMGSTTGTDYVIITATNNSATKTATTNVTNTKDSTNYAPYNYTASVAIGNGLTAGGGEAVVTASASHMAYDYYTSGSYNNSHSVSDGVSWSIVTQTFTPSGGSASTITRFSKSGNTLSHTTMTSNIGTDYVKVTATNSSNTSTTASAEKSITNTKDSTNYAPYNYTASVSIINNNLTAAGGSATVTASASHMAYDYYTSGSYNNQHTVTDSVTWSITTQTFTPSGGSASTITRFSKSNNTLSHTSMTSNVGTDYVKITATNSSNTSTTSTAEKSITNELGTQKYKNTSGTTGYNIVYNVPTVTIGSGLSAAGGSATVTCSVTNGTNWYQKYTSGTYTGQQTGTEAGTARWMITSNGNSRFSHPSSGGTSLSGVGTVYDSGASVSHGNMITNATTDTVTVTVYNVGDVSKTKTASASVSNELTGIALSLGSGSIKYNSTTTATVTATYTSGSSKDVTDSLSTSPSATSNYIKSGDTSIVTIS